MVPKNHVITTTLEVLEERPGSHRVCVCIGRASLWVDGRRIYEAEPIGMRLVESPLPIEPEPAPVSDESSSSPASNSSNLWTDSEPNASKTIPPSDESGIPPTELEVHPDGGARFDLGEGPWLKGHRPSGGVSVLPMAMLLDLIAREAGTARYLWLIFKLVSGFGWTDHSDYGWNNLASNSIYTPPTGT